MFIANCHTGAKVPDVERRVEQIDRRLDVFHPSFRTRRLSVVFGKGRGAEEDLGPRADEARVEGLDGMDLEPREDAAQQISKLIRGPSHTEQEFVRWAFLSLAGGLCLLLPLGLSRPRELNRALDRTGLPDEGLQFAASGDRPSQVGSLPFQGVNFPVQVLEISGEAMHPLETLARGGEQGIPQRREIRRVLDQPAKHPLPRQLDRHLNVIPARPGRTIEGVLHRRCFPAMYIRLPQTAQVAACPGQIDRLRGTFWRLDN